MKVMMVCAGALMFGASAPASAQQVDVEEIRVVDEVDHGIASRVYRNRHDGERELVGYAAAGHLAGEEVRCQTGERFTAETAISGYLQITWGNNGHCAQKVKIVMRAPRVTLALVKIAEAEEAAGNHGAAAVLYSDVQQRLTFDARAEDGSSQKAQFAIKSFRNAEQALGLDGIYALSDKGWPALTPSGAEAIAQLQREKGLPVTGRLDAVAYKALSDKNLGAYIGEAYGLEEPGVQ